ncbi:DUF5998 family protein [Brevibacterium sp. 50QC2O2]|jgi:hypothetical protein|uniref:DUF5998 family protein n=1 Tax=Brevibacterium TaxID=1696 RepID=UPI00211BCD28|nr:MULTISPECIES: DUF5998 family protein [unclassified Brevibacterium]MCQ9368473.1 DUF5998 family protein [Brevibacterium sp. 91QC2O2]MCQ9385947.1 DUF5998 family protein [Brevibacterium sp. 68QC2CO]MCQ9387387.1 DUF5998 family protein [Brevibacterium sp. 50QC2O2]
MSVPTELIHDLQNTGYYPQLTQDLIAEVLYGEDVLAHIVQMDTHIDLESIHRHVTVFAVTETRLLLAHVDDDQGEAGRPAQALTNTEEIALERVSCAVLGRVYNEPARYTPGQRPIEVSVNLAWGNVRRLDVYPETCADPACEGDHGYAGSEVGDDVNLRVAAQAEGQAAVDRAEHFALTLKRLVHRARLLSRRS